VHLGRRLQPGQQQTRGVVSGLGHTFAEEHCLTGACLGGQQKRLAHPTRCAPSNTTSAVPKTAGPAESILEKAASVVLRRAGTVVGRVTEKEILAACFADAKQGNGNIVLIRGEAGIGKSSLAYAFTQTVDPSEAVVVYGQCHETLGSPPFWPWLQVLKSLQSSEQSAQVTSTNIFESLASAAPQATSGSHSTFSRDAGTEQFLLFSQIDSVVAQYASLRPLILVLDDLHWADRSSLLLLTHVCRKLSERPIQIVGTYRELEITRKHPLFESLGEINRQTTLRRIALKGLSEEDVSGYVQSVVKQPLPAVVLRSLYEKTEGNPLFMSEVTRLLLHETQQPTNDKFVIEIPNGIQEAIGQRLNELSDKCNELLGMASVIGRNFNLRELSELLTDTDELKLLHTLEEAVARGIVNELSQGIASFQFCHVLIRDILYAELSLAKKIPLHRKVADSLAQLHASGAEVSLGEIARHYYQALQGGQGEHAVHYAIEAAKHAYRLSAFDEARSYYEIALDVFRVDESRYAIQKPEVLLRIALCLQGAGQFAGEPLR
jgi:predicted ATPase